MKDPRNLIIVALLVGGAFLLGTNTASNTAHGQGYPGGSTDSNGSMIAVTGTIGSGVSVLWLIDSVERQIAVYQSRGGKTIELVAARKIEWDLKIEEFHDESFYSPEQLQKLFYGKGGGIKPPKEDVLGEWGKTK